LEVNK